MPITQVVATSPLNQSAFGIEGLLPALHLESPHFSSELGLPTALPYVGNKRDQGERESDRDGVNPLGIEVSNRFRLMSPLHLSLTLFCN